MMTLSICRTAAFQLKYPINTPKPISKYNDNSFESYFPQSSLLLNKISK